MSQKSTHILGELEKVQEDIPKYKKQSEAAQVSKDEVLEELDMTKKLIEELRHSLEKTETEEAQAKQDSELAQLRVKEMEQGISDDASTAAKAQMEVAKSRHTAAVDELKSVKKELEALQGDYHRLVTERDSAMARSEEAVSAAKDAEKKAEDLTLELMTIKEALESAHASHLEAEERRIGLAMAKDQDVLNWEKDLAKAKEELKQLSDQQSSVEDLKAKLEITSTMLLNLKTELTFYMEGKLLQDTGIIKEESETSITKTSVQSELSSARKELEAVKTIIEKTKDEANCLREAASSLKAQLDRETETFTTLKQREGITSVSVSSLEAELSRMLSELELVLTREREAREKTEELSKLLQQATYDAGQAKSVSQLAGEELRKAKEEAEEAKAGVSTTEARLLAVLKEIEAAKASEALAVAAIKAMVDCEKKKGEVGVSTETESEAPTDTEVVTLQLEEYYTLSKNAYDAEELANERVISAVEQIKEAKKSEQLSLEKLEEANKELEEKKEALKAAVEMADKAHRVKLTAEQELRDWRTDTEQRRRASDAGASHLEMSPSESTLESSEERGEASRPPSGEASLRLNSMSCPDLYVDHHAPELKPRRKKSFFPRIVMFLARKKAQTLD